jgi:hypothetical protein
MHTSDHAATLAARPGSPTPGAAAHVSRNQAPVCAPSVSCSHNRRTCEMRHDRTFHRSHGSLGSGYGMLLVDVWPQSDNFLTRDSAGI